MNYLLILLVSALAGARMWRLTAVDEAGQPFRTMVWNFTNRLQGSSARGKRSLGDKVADSVWAGITCPFCWGFWLTSAFVASGLLWSDGWGWQLVAGCFAASYVSGQLAAWLDVVPIHEGGGEITPEGVEAPNESDNS